MVLADAEDRNAAVLLLIDEPKASDVGETPCSEQLCGRDSRYGKADTDDGI
jgi:hypothetical protein